MHGAMEFCDLENVCAAGTGPDTFFRLPWIDDRGCSGFYSAWVSVSELELESDCGDSASQKYPTIHGPCSSDGFRGRVKGLLSAACFVPDAFAQVPGFALFCLEVTLIFSLRDQRCLCLCARLRYSAGLSLYISQSARDVDVGVWIL